MEKKTLEKTVEKIASDMSKLNEVVKKLVTKEEFKRLEQRTERLEKTTEKIAIIVTDHTEKIKGLVTGEEFNKKFDIVLQGQDKVLAILTHLERERIFAFDRIEKLEGEVNRIKKHIALV